MFPPQALPLKRRLSWVSLSGGALSATVVSVALLVIETVYYQRRA